MGLDNLTFQQKHFLIDLLVDRIEVTQSIKEIKVHVILRFDPKKLVNTELGYTLEKDSSIALEGVQESQKTINGG